ncbi:MAG: DUF1631 domain-containing protein, partial [Gammaproteobacteria bacterium]|nr:DUF1631 domain-containing protein [Gammaproteobacteria bacterium]
MTTRSDNRTKNTSNGSEIFEKVLNLNIQGIDLLLKDMFTKVSHSENWDLPEKESKRLITQIGKKKRIIKSSFVFQLKKNFTDFKAVRKTRLHENMSSDWLALGPVGDNERNETRELESMISRFEDRYNEYYQLTAKRLGHCVNRTRTELHDNPMHVKRLFQSFQYAIDSLGLETRHKISLYRLFANAVIEKLEPLYNSVEQCFIEHHVLPDLKLIPKKSPAQESSKQSVPNDSVAMARIPVLMGVFQTFKDKSEFTGDKYANMFPELKGELANHQISEFDHLLDQLCKKFDFIFDDDDLPDRIKGQIARLQIYLFMSSIQESDLLKRSSNPARRLLDTIIRTEVDFAVGQHDEQSGFEYLRDQIDRISNNPFIESSAYAELLEGYLEYTSGKDGSQKAVVEPLLPRTEPEPEP